MPPVTATRSPLRSKSLSTRVPPLLRLSPTPVDPSTGAAWRKQRRARTNVDSNAGLQVQVNLKSSDEDASPLCPWSPSFRSRRFHAAAASPRPRCRYYEERGLIASQRARSGHRRYPRAVAAPHCLHRLRAADRIVARGDRRGTREASRRTGRQHARTGRASPVPGPSGSTRRSPSFSA